MAVQQDTAGTSEGRKRRVVGTVVLLALALIVLPQLFDGEGSYQPKVESRIPEKPIITLIPEPRQSRPVMASDAAAVAVEPPDEPARIIDLSPLSPPEVEREDTGAAADPDVAELDAEALEPARPTLAADGLPEGWVVQVGSFAELANATALVDSLLASDYRAYQRRTARAGGELATVYVGPVLDRAAADRLRQQLLAERGIEGLVKTFELEALP